MAHPGIALTLLLFTFAPFLASCGPEVPPSEGQRIFAANCAMCHTMDPTAGGPRGPALAGASIELLQKKVLDGRYPAGYEPKRRTAMMPTFPGFEPYIPELAEYLQNP